MRSPIRTGRQVSSRPDQKEKLCAKTSESDPNRSGLEATDAPDRKVHGGGTVADVVGGDSHEEGGGEHESDGDHDDGQRRVPLHRHGARDRLQRLRHPITQNPPSVSASGSQAEPQIQASVGSGGLTIPSDLPPAAVVAAAALPTTSSLRWRRD